MRKIVLKSLTAVFSLFLTVVLFCSCGSKEVAEVATNKDVPLVIMVDGKNITMEDTKGKTVEELLKDARITLNDGDVISMDTDKKLSESIVIKILRKATVTVVNSINGEEYTVILIGRTVKDAIDAAGIKLAKNYTTNYKLDDALKDKMKIVISIKEEPQTTEPYTPDENSDNNSGNNSGNNSNSGSNNRPDSNSSVTKAPAPTKPAPTKPAPTKPAEPTTSGRTIVSVEIYEDCDGSGHGVKVITYSDGTQEEVAF